MDNTILIVLGVILLVLIILNHITIITTTTTTNEQANCSQTTFGCCPDGVNSKVNFYGTNCPSFKPGPGYYPNRPYIPPPPLPPGPGPMPPKPIGGCTGTRHGCCPNNQTPKIDTQGSNCLLK